MSKRHLIGVLTAAVMLTSGFIGSGQPAASTDQAAHPSLDDLLVAEVSSRVPGFGGFFIDETAGTINIWLTEGSVEEAQAALAAALERESFATLAPVKLEARYTFAELKGWHDRLSPNTLALPGTVSTDVDERHNRLVVGVENLDFTGPVVSAQLGQLGVPSEAVAIVQEDPVRFASSLRDFHRPLVGGLQILWVDNSNGSQFICTLGFPAVRNGVTGFVTNSHCSTTQGTVDASQIYHQPTGGAPPLLRQDVGRETVDPGLFTGGTCPAGRRCRRSDANFAQLQGSHLIEGATAVDQGQIAWPVNSGDPAWSGQRFEIRSSFNAVVGENATKVGRTTGRTFNVVDSTCVNVNVSGTDITMLCQSRVPGMNVQGGDSGSPVIRRENGNQFGTLAGIIWGAGANNTAFYSNFTEVEAEVGELTVCAPGFFC